MSTLALLIVQKAYKAEIKQFGKRIKKIRKANSITQTELAGLCDVDIRTIQRIESGEYGVGLHILFALADALEIEASALLKN